MSKTEDIPKALGYDESAVAGALAYRMAQRIAGLLDADALRIARVYPGSEMHGSPGDRSRWSIDLTDAFGLSYTLTVDLNRVYDDDAEDGEG